MRLRVSALVQAQVSICSSSTVGDRVADSGPTSDKSVANFDRWPGDGRAPATIGRIGRVANDIDTWLKSLNAGGPCRWGCDESW